METSNNTVHAWALLDGRVSLAALSPAEEGRDVLGLGAIFSAHGALADAVLQVLAAGVAPAVDGGGDAGGAPLGVAVLRGTADHLPHGVVHVLVLVRVDDGVHDRVEQRQQQEPALHVLHVALLAVQAVQQQHHQPWGPAHHEGACGEKSGRSEGCLNLGMLLQGFCPCPWCFLTRRGNLQPSEEG